MTSSPHDRTRVFADAVRWLSAFQDGAADRTAFFAWLAESPRHVEELTFALALQQSIAELSPEQRVEIEQLAHRASGRDQGACGDDEHADHAAPILTDPPPNVIPLRTTSVASGIDGRHKPHRFARRIAALSSAAACICALTLAAWWMGLGPFGWTTYATSIGEQRTVALRDGSIVQLNTDSQLKLRMTDAARELRLMRGEALFTVHHDPQRPFRVHTNDAVIRAIGTQFNVRHHSAGTRVAVLEGIVEVATQASAASTTTDTSRAAPREAATSQDAQESSLETSNDQPADANARTSAAKPVVRLAAGEMADVLAADQVARRALANPGEVIAWRQRRLVFHDTPLAEIAEEFNRYNHSPRIRVEGQAARAQRFAGTFDADAPEALIAALDGNPTLAIDQGADEIVIRER